MRSLIFNSFPIAGTSAIALIIRLSLGIVFCAHGAQKVLGWFGGYGLEGTVGWMNGELGIPVALAYPACLIEFVGGILLFIGFLTRLWAVGLATMMLVAMLTAHTGFFNPNGIEFPLSAHVIFTRRAFVSARFGRSQR